MKESRLSPLVANIDMRLLIQMIKTNCEKSAERIGKSRDWGAGKIYQIIERNFFRAL